MSDIFSKETLYAIENNKELSKKFQKTIDNYVAGSNLQSIKPSLRMNVKAILLQYLQANGYDGLSYTCCGCGVDDLVPCDGVMDDCRPARKVVCKDTGFKDCTTCDYGCSEAEREVAAIYIALEDNDTRNL